MANKGMKLIHNRGVFLFVGWTRREIQQLSPDMNEEALAERLGVDRVTKSQYTAFKVALTMRQAQLAKTPVGGGLSKRSFNHIEEDWNNGEYAEFYIPSSSAGRAMAIDKMFR